MTTTAPPATAPVGGSGTRAALDVAFGLPIAVGAAVGTWWLLSAPASYLLVAVAVYVSMGTLIVVTVPSDLPRPGLGAANRVTLLRAALAVPIFALCLPPVALGTVGAWVVIVLGTIAMVLDGVDGRIARRTGSGSAFGARFDMEVDAALILALSVLVWAGDRAGAWCLLMGLLRYLFVVAGWLVPALGRPLPESLRRKGVCVAQGVVLLVALGPIIPDLMATMVVAGGLAALLYSFGVDTAWALRDGAAPATHK